MGNPYNLLRDFWIADVECILKDSSLLWKNYEYLFLRIRNIGRITDGTGMPYVTLELSNCISNQYNKPY